MPLPLMPKATAVWLIDNTLLTFNQIAEFCGLHPLEVKGIADGEVAVGIQGRDPVPDGELTREEIERCVADPSARLNMAESDIPRPKARTSGPKYTPVTKRQDRPNAIMWLLRYHSELSDAQISRLIGTTKPTIDSVRERTHWNMANLKSIDPVSLGMCSQAELDEVVTRTHARLRSREALEREAAAADEGAASPTVVPVFSAARPPGASAVPTEPAPPSGQAAAEATPSGVEPTAASVFGTPEASPGSSAAPQGGGDASPGEEDTAA